MEWFLRLACFKFNCACHRKIEAKEKQGFYGWDDPKNKESLKEDLIEHTKKTLTQKNLIDISNYCNFLWNILENQKGIRP